MSRFAAIDFETANGYRTSVCSVGIVVVEDGQIIDRIYRLIRPYPNYYNSINTSIHGLTKSDTDEEDDFSVVWSEIAPKIAGLELVAHNSPFDSSCLRAACDKFGLEYNYMFKCTLSASRRRFPHLPNHKLNSVAEHCGYDLSHHHHALADAQACAHIAIEIDLFQ